MKKIKQLLLQPFRWLKRVTLRKLSQLKTIAKAIWRYLKRVWKRLQPLIKNVWIASYVVLAITASQITLLWKPIAGVYVNAAVLTSLIGIALWYRKIRQLAISVAIIPTATMVVLSLPQTTNFARDVVFYEVILVLGLIYRIMFSLDYPIQQTHLPIKNYAFALSMMAVAGEVLGVLSYGMLRHQYPFAHTSLPLVAATVVVFAFAEETLFRGLIQQRASVIMHPLLAAIVPTMLFTLMSINTTTYLAPLFSLILGATLSLTYAKKPNLVLTGTINALSKLTYIGLMATFVFR